MAFATAFHEDSPQTTFCILSGQGADQIEWSSMEFARYKGAAEKALVDLGFPRVRIFRPGYIFPVTPRKEPNRFYQEFRALYPEFRLFYPNIGISFENLARAVLFAGLHETPGNENPVLENKNFRSITCP